ncbi:hypothetical protein A374_14255 [Fictibacillus macauensis ZFHKF-1]|uniref:Phosphoribosyl-ATP pyrophosphohydrolase n=1 Tax=Fictibacillus macauensis ZFHKF-1 TaxID=1196324 RepID=I8IZD6_9BACL|nr:nucleoside triphosphate pyrophosphohydrolase [Fictibacillus macauensis]EIT84861.1 hypothetical protein A374_14255 [Fictibacillus macauensis ZFHKF-1]
MPTYHKLVRDRIPAIIEQSGKTCRTKIVDDNEYREALQKKSYEEFEEYIQATTDEQAVEELADLLEVMHALARVHGVSFAEVEAVRKEKADKRGGFLEKVFLIDVDEK